MKELGSILIGEKQGVGLRSWPHKLLGSQGVMAHDGGGGVWQQQRQRGQRISFERDLLKNLINYKLNITLY